MNMRTTFDFSPFYRATVGFDRVFHMLDTAVSQGSQGYPPYNIEKAGELRGLFSQLTLSALDTVGPTIAGLPVLGPALPALTGIVGLFIGSGRLRKEKEASFNKGLEKGSGLAGTGGGQAGSAGSRGA